MIDKITMSVNGLIDVEFSKDGFEVLGKMPYSDARFVLTLCYTVGQIWEHQDILDFCDEN